MQSKVSSYIPFKLDYKPLTDTCQYFRHEIVKSPHFFLIIDSWLVKFLAIESLRFSGVIRDRLLSANNTRQTGRSYCTHTLAQLGLDQYASKANILHTVVRGTGGEQKGANVG